MKIPPRHCPAGFTLTELLVVTVIILTLVSPDDIRAIDAQGGASHAFWKANAQ